MSEDDIHVRPIRQGWPAAVSVKIRDALAGCPDVAFAYLVEAGGSELEEHHTAVFVWLTPGALRSLRSALNLVSAAVAEALPDGVPADVLILNSAPDLLDRLEASGGLLVEVDSDERRRALEAVASGAADTTAVTDSGGWWWWPF